MARILAIDYGRKRTGIAVTDPLQLIASGLTTVPTQELLSFLTRYMEKEGVERIVVGEPKQLNGTPSEIEGDILKFMQTLRKAFPSVPLQRTDERFTSKMALRTMIEGGVKKKARRNKALTDEISATIILQSYLSTLQ